jgi:hypothetical protein
MSSPLIARLPVGQRRPNPGEFHVIWQVYLFARSEADAQHGALDWLKASTPWGMYYGVIDSNDRALTVEGVSVRGWSLFDRPTDPSEYMVVWETYIQAPDLVEAKQIACQQMEEQGDSILPEFVAVQLR